MLFKVNLIIMIIFIFHFQFLCLHFFTVLIPNIIIPFIFFLYWLHKNYFLYFFERHLFSLTKFIFLSINFKDFLQNFLKIIQPIITMIPTMQFLNRIFPLEFLITQLRILNQNKKQSNPNFHFQFFCLMFFHFTNQLLSIQYSLINFLYIHFIFMNPLSFYF